jgi:hypothetical protein
MLQYTRNTLQFLKFPQCQKPFFNLQRENVRKIWEACYFARDFEGALIVSCFLLLLGPVYDLQLQSLELLCQIDTLTIEDFEKFLHILTVYPHERKLLITLAHQSFNNVRLTSSKAREQRSLVMHLLMKFFFSNAEMDYWNEAKTVLKTFRSSCSESFQPVALAIESLIAMHQVYRIAMELVETKKESFPHYFPDLFHIVKNPWNFFFHVRLVEISCKQTDIPSYLLINAIKELILTLQTSIANPITFHWPDYQTLYSAVLLGIADRPNLQKHFLMLQRQVILLEDTEQANERKLYYRQISELLISFLTLVTLKEQRIRVILDLVRIRLQMLACELRQQLAVSKDNLFTYYFFYSYGLVDKDTWLLMLANYVEETHEEETQSRHQEGLWKQWLEWAMLVECLGKLPCNKLLDDPISAYSEVVQFIPEIVIANNLTANDGNQHVLEKQRNHLQLNLQKLTETGITMDATRLKFILERNWWLESILSVSKLDEFSRGIIDMDLQQNESLSYLLGDLTAEHSKLQEELKILPLPLIHQFNLLDNNADYWQIIRTQLDQFLFQEQVDIEAAATAASTDGDDQDTEHWHNLLHLDDDLFAPLPMSVVEVIHDMQTNQPQRYDQFCTDLFSLPISGDSMDPFFHYYCQIHNENKQHNNDYYVKGRIIEIPNWFSNNEGLRGGASDERISTIEDTYQLGNKLLELLTFHALVASHLQDQDNFFTVRIVQILIAHATRTELKANSGETAAKCLQFLFVYNVNIARCIAKGLEYVSRRISVYDAPPMIYTTDDMSYLSGDQYRHYIPVKL